MAKLATWLGVCVVLGCSSPDIDELHFACETDSDCTAGDICGTLAGERACISAAQSPIRIGLSAPFQGPSRDLGIDMRRGLLASFDRVNREGGVGGRPLQLESLNDNYDPELARANMLQLLDVKKQSESPDEPDVRGPDGVFAFVGNVGTPTMLVTAPIATKNETVFFGPFTGSQKYLRDGTNSPYVYNVRAGYFDETEAMVDYMASFRSPRIITTAESYENLLVFAQNDSYGDAGYDGFVGAYDRNIAPLQELDGRAEAPSVRKVTYEREDLASVDEAVERTRQFLSEIIAGSATATTSVGIVMIDTYLPGAKFIRAIKEWINQDVARSNALDVLFMHVSFVGSDALAKALTDPPATYPDVTDPSGGRELSYAEGVMVTQVVPYYQSQAPGVRRYRTDLSSYDGGTFSFTSLEGYINAELFVEGLRRCQSELNSESLIGTLDSMGNVDLGIGSLLGFSPVRHQASSTVWGSRIEADGTFSIPFRWTPRERITPEQN